ncbi:hypothetical protein EVAR_79278_1 [Eumeta japonica]|uniref:Uncharacterized protein n=1 Tax=Eumeta variegata TaxID=151549 RepID=A0A4C1TI05_EUMVA|nr:hypothetical protein EVAR_79278_1 [Eumeta japonica]
MNVCHRVRRRSNSRRLARRVYKDIAVACGLRGDADLYTPRIQMNRRLTSDIEGRRRPLTRQPLAQNRHSIDVFNCTRVGDGSFVKLLRKYVDDEAVGRRRGEWATETLAQWTKYNSEAGYFTSIFCESVVPRAVEVKQTHSRLWNCCAVKLLSVTMNALHVYLPFLGFRTSDEETELAFTIACKSHFDGERIIWSSAYMRHLTYGSFIISRHSFKSYRQLSINRVNNHDEATHPCLIPLRISNQGGGLTIQFPVGDTTPERVKIVTRDNLGTHDFRIRNGVAPLQQKHIRRALAYGNFSCDRRSPSELGA